jgi:hypothetical protein
MKVELTSILANLSLEPPTSTFNVRAPAMRALFCRRAACGETSVALAGASVREIVRGSYPFAGATTIG